MKGNKLLISFVLVWVVLAIVNATNVEAFSFGALSNINKDYFSWQLWANTLLIGVVIYFTLTFLVKLKMDSPQGMWISIIMVGLVSFLIASNPIRATGHTPVFILQQENVKIMMDTFLNPTTGIIGNPKRLGVFIGSILVFLWLFHFLNIGGKDEFSSKLNIALALLVGYNMATNPKVGPDMVLAVGQVVACMVIRKNLVDGGIKHNVAAFFMAMGLVLWISNIAFPQYHGALFYGLKFVGIAAGWTMLGGVVLFAVGFGIYLIGRPLLAPLSAKIRPFIVNAVTGFIRSRLSRLGGGSPP